MPIAGTFTVVMDPHEVSTVEPDDSGKLTVRFQGGADFITIDGDLITLDDKISRRGVEATSVSAGYAVDLPTDIGVGGDHTTSLVGYDLLWFSPDARVPALFKARAAGSTWQLSDLLNPEPIPTAESAANADRAEAAAESAADDALAAGTSATAASGSAASAQASAAEASALVISDLGTTDGQMDALLKGSTSVSRATLRKQFGTHIAPTDPRFGAVGDGVTDDTTAMLAWLDTLISAGTVTNLETRPSIEVGNSWAAVSGSTTPAQSTEFPYVGTYSVKFQRGSGTGIQLGRRSSFTTILPGAGTYRYTARLRVSANQTGNSGLKLTGTGITGTPTAYVVARDTYTEASLTFTWDGVGTANLDVVDEAITSGAVTYLDAAILTSGSAVVPFFDGDTVDTPVYVYSWTGTVGNSSSVRSQAGTVEGFIPAGRYRITAPLKRRDCGVSLTIRGAGSSQTYLFGDFVGAGEAILDLSNEDATSYSTKSHHISGLGFLGRGTPGDPQGLYLKNANGCVVSDIRVDHGINGDWALANSGVVVTNDNNSTFTNINLRGGWQPKAFNLGTATVSFTSGSPTITATSSVFTAAMVGKTIYFPDGSNNGAHDEWKATITAQSGTACTININAPTTASGIAAVVGHVTGSATAGSTSLVLDNVVGLTSAYVGMQVHVMGGALKTGSGNTAGLHSTRVASVSGNTITLVDPVTVTVSSATILFAPALFVGSFGAEIAEAGRQTNDSFWSDVRCISYNAAGLIVNTAIYLHFNNLKIHGPGIQRPDWGQAYYSAVFSEVKKVKATGMQADYTILGPKIHVSGSRGTLALDNLEVGHMWSDSPIVHVATASDDFRLYPGLIHIMYDLTNFPTTWVPFTSPLRSHVQGGQVVLRTKDRTLSKSRAIVQPGITGQEGGGVGVQDDTVFSFRPHGSTNGFLHFNDGKSNTVHGIVKYRTSEDSAGAYVTALIVGADVNVGSGTLTGTTGTDGKLTVSADASGNLQIENRRGSTRYISLYWGPYGF